MSSHFWNTHGSPGTNFPRPATIKNSRLDSSTQLSTKTELGRPYPDTGLLWLWMISAFSRLDCPQLLPSTQGASGCTCFWLLKALPLLWPLIPIVTLFVFLLFVFCSCLLASPSCYSSLHSSLPNPPVPVNAAWLNSHLEDIPKINQASGSATHVKLEKNKMRKVG